MKKVLVFGCGSIGAHHSNAATKLNCCVYVTDINKEQFYYFKNHLYPSRYGKWNKLIKFIDYNEVFKQKLKFDLIVIGTSPVNHLEVIEKCNLHLKFEKILVEKPLMVYNQRIRKSLINQIRKNTYCGFNHELSKSITLLKKIILKNKKNIKYIKISWQESFDYLLSAHPWIQSLKKSYLSNLEIGGGVMHEFSHAVHLSKNISEILKFKKLEVKKIEYKKINKFKYDQLINFFFKKNKCIMEINIDSVSKPPKKEIDIYLKNKEIKWVRDNRVRFEKITFLNSNSRKITKVKKFKISRPGEFIDQMKLYLSKNKKDILKLKCNSLQSSLDTTKIIKKCLKSL